ncbi:MAG: hypothetical protein ACFFEO_13560 [Candidatus Thorarchaeota archaeon]
MILYIVNVFHPQKLIYKICILLVDDFETLFKIHKEIARWEKFFPKFEEWAQELEQFPLEKRLSRIHKNEANF